MVFKTKDNTIFKQEPNLQTKHKMQKLMHKIPCGCSKVYIGENTRLLEICIQEHPNYINNKSKICIHACDYMFHKGENNCRKIKET